jgi:ATP-dependent Lon protease
MSYLLIPLDEAIVFPTVTATLPINVGDEERVFLIPRREGASASSPR